MHEIALEKHLLHKAAAAAAVAAARQGHWGNERTGLAVTGADAVPGAGPCLKLNHRAAAGKGPAETEAGADSGGLNQCQGILVGWFGYGLGVGNVFALVGV